MSGYKLRRRWKVRAHGQFGAYVGGTSARRAECLRNVIAKLMQGEIDVIKVQFEVDPTVYSVWACDVIIVATILDDTAYLIDVIDPAANSV